MVNNPLTTTELPKYEIIEYNGRQARRYPDGSIRDERGRMLANLPGTENKAITSQNAPALARKRAENYRRAAVRRIVGEAAAVDPSISSGADAFAIVAARQWAALMDYEKPRIEDLQRMRDLMTGADDKRKEEEGRTVTHIHQMDAATVALLERIAKQQAEDVVNVIPMRTDIEADE